MLLVYFYSYSVAPLLPTSQITANLLHDYHKLEHEQQKQGDDNGGEYNPDFDFCWRDIIQQQIQTLRCVV
jgi:hypothetical protein